MEIRNQFMHNLEAASYEKCFDFIDGKENFILKAYPQDPKKSREKQLEKAAEKLSSDILTICVNLYDKVKEKIEKEVKFDMLQKAQPVLLKALVDLDKKKKTTAKIGIANSGA